MEATKKFEGFQQYMECIKYFLREGTHQDSTSRGVRKAIYKATLRNQFKIDEAGVLFHKAPTSEIWQRVITSEEERQSILFNCHTAPSAGHSGVNATTEKITQRFYWRGIKGDVRDYISKCDSCQRFQRIKTEAPEPHTVVVVEPLHKVGMDLIGPLPETLAGNKYILTLIDYFTKWVEFYPLKHKAGPDVAEKIQSYVYRYGSPKKLVSHQGREFVDNINTALAEKFGIERMVTPANHPQAKGMGERTSHTVKTRLSKLCNKEQNDWDKYLEAVAFSLRTQKHSSTKFTPFFLMYNREARLPIELATLNDDDDENQLNSPTSSNLEPKPRKRGRKVNK